MQRNDFYSNLHHFLDKPNELLLIAGKIDFECKSIRFHHVFFYLFIYFRYLLYQELLELAFDQHNCQRYFSIHLILLDNFQ